MASLAELIAAKAAAAGNPAAAVPVQNTSASATSTDSTPSVEIAKQSLSGGEIASGIEGAGSAPDTAAPVREHYEPDEEKMAAAYATFQINRAMPFIAAPDGSKVLPDGQFYYLSEEQVADLDILTYVKRENLIVVAFPDKK